MEGFGFIWLESDGEWYDNILGVSILGIIFGVMVLNWFLFCKFLLFWIVLEGMFDLFVMII